MNESVLIASLITITVVNCGALFENKSWVKVAENSRILIFSGFAFYFSFINQWDMLLLMGGAAYLLISFTWLNTATFSKTPAHA